MILVLIFKVLLQHLQLVQLLVRALYLLLQILLYQETMSGTSFMWN